MFIKISKQIASLGELNVFTLRKLILSFILVEWLCPPPFTLSVISKNIKIVYVEIYVRFQIGFREQDDPNVIAIFLQKQIEQKSSIKGLD